MSIKQLVDETISGHKVAIFSKSWCQYSKRTKDLFANEFPEADVKVLELDLMDEGDDIQAYLKDLTGQRTVPNVFIGQKHIGGSDDLIALHKRQGVKNLL